LIVGIVGAIFSLLFCLALWCGWNQLKLAIEIVNCSADFLAATKRLLSVPILYYLVLFCFFLFWLACVISVMCMGKIDAHPHGILYVPF